MARSPISRMIAGVPDPSEGPVFIVGMNGSGTTMMLDHLGHHPQLHGFKLETYVLPHYLMTEHKYGELGIDTQFLRLWNDMRSEYPFRRANQGQAFELPADWASVPRSASGVFDRIMQAFAEREGKGRWCEKTPMYALHIERLGREFPASRFIHMVRDGRNCAISNRRRWGRHPDGTIYRWKHVVAEARRQGRLLPDRYLEVRYEDVTGDPDVHMRRICEFIGVDFDARVLSTSRSRVWMTGHESRTIEKANPASVRRLSGDRLETLERIAGKRLASLGYDTSCPQSDFDPRVPKRFWWAIHDTFYILTRQIKNKITRQKRMTWPLFFARLSAIFRQVRNSRPSDPSSRRNRD